MTGGLGNQMFIYAFYMKMKRLFPNTRIDLSDMMHYHVHNGYELHRIFQQLPEDEFCMPQKTKKVIEFLFFKTILERKQDLTTLRAFFKRRLWPLVYFKGFYQDERYFKDIEDEVRGAFAFNTALCNEKTLRMLRQIEADEDAVSLHVRRGDYLQPSVWRNTGCGASCHIIATLCANLKSGCRERPIITCFQTTSNGPRRICRSRMPPLSRGTRPTRVGRICCS